MRSRLAKVLFSYRLTPQTTTGLAPAELLLGRRPRTRLDLLKPHTAERVEQKQREQKAQHDSRGKPPTFSVGDSIFLKNTGSGSGWLPGKIVSRSGPVSFHVLLEDGRQKCCHQDQLKPRLVDDRPPELSETDVGTLPSEEDSPVSVDTPSEPTTDSQPTGQEQEPVPPEPPNHKLDSNTTDTHIRQYPRRQQRPCEWFEPGKS